MWRILVALRCIFSIAAAECIKGSQSKHIRTMDVTNLIQYINFVEVLYYHDCMEALEKGNECSGVYNIKPDKLPPFQVSINY